jgi:sulfatase modifying factor 1
VHSVVVSSFYMDRFEVTKELWDQVYQWAAGNGYTFTVGVVGDGVAANHPVQNVNWYDAVRWCNARSQKEGRTPAYYTDAAQTLIYKTDDMNLTAAKVKWTSNGYRLPTEAEWEKAARGGLAGHHFPWPSIGPDYNAFIDGSKANYNDGGDPFAANSVPTTPVGYYNSSQVPAGVDMANGYGLYDMAGNVLEWCWDWRADLDASTVTDPHGPDTGSYRINRGGSWIDSAVYLRLPSRDYRSPEVRAPRTGFRCVLAQP